MNVVAHSHYQEPTSGSWGSLTRGVDKSKNTTSEEAEEHALAYAYADSNDQIIPIFH
jgi:hypothetical protein